MTVTDKYRYKGNLPKHLFSILKVVIFVGAIYFVYSELAQAQNSVDWSVVFKSDWSYLILVATVLMPINWGLEAYKWKILVSDVYQAGFLESMRVIFIGVAAGIITPNQLGSFFGRIVSVPRKKKKIALARTVVGSYAQMLVTFAMGAIGGGIILAEGIPLRSEVDKVIGTSIAVCSLGSVGALVFYFIAPKISDKIQKLKYLKSLGTLSSLSSKLLVFVLIASIIRYLVFLIQLHLLLVLFGFDEGITLSIALIGILYGIIAFIPSPGLGKFGIREMWMILIFAPQFMAEMEAFGASVLLMIINLLIPALIGSLLVLGQKTAKDD